MTQIPLDIDRVVREVLAELQRTSGGTTNLRSVPGLSGSAKSTSGASGGTTNLRSVPGLSGIAKSTVGQSEIRPEVNHNNLNNSELVISTRLVTMEEIDGRLAGIRQVVVSPQAVVTPTVRDVLRQRNITLSRASTTAKAAITPLRLVVVAARTKFDPKLLAGTLHSEGIDVQCHATDCLLAATDRLAGELAKSDALGLLLTPHTAAAMCLANRRSGVRAVLGNNTGSLAADLGAVGANLLVVDPQIVGMFKLAQMAGEFFRGGIRPCPEVFKKRLT